MTYNVTRSVCKNAISKRNKKETKQQKKVISLKQVQFKVSEDNYSLNTVLNNFLNNR